MRPAGRVFETHDVRSLSLTSVEEIDETMIKSECLKFLVAQCMQIALEERVVGF